MRPLLLVIGIYGFLEAASQGSSTVTNTLPVTPPKPGDQGSPTVTNRLPVTPSRPGEQRAAGIDKQNKDTITSVNITEEAWKLIDNMNKSWHDIMSWGMTSDYAFWTGKHNIFGEQPISANAGDFTCDKELSDYDDTDVKVASYLWFMPQKICSPVAIYVSVTLPWYTKGTFEEKEITLDFNNRHTITKVTPRKKRRRKTKGLEKTVETCAFTVNVTFYGCFAYETHSPSGGSQFYSIRVGTLQDKAKGLVKTKRNLLSYTIRGRFKRVMYWKNSPNYEPISLQ